MNNLFGYNVVSDSNDNHFPEKGWINYIRKKLGISLDRLANVLNINKSSVLRFEQNEIKKKVQLESLDKIAEALDLELVYFFRPKNGLTFEEYFLNLTKQHSKNNVDSYSLNKGIIINNDDEKLALISELQQFYLDNPKKMWE